MTLLPAISSGLRLLLLKALAIPFGAGVLFGALLWLLRGVDLMQGWFLPSAVFLAITSILVCSVLGEIAFAQNRSVALRVGYYAFGIGGPAVFVFSLGRTGIALSLVTLALLVMALPTEKGASSHEV